MMSFFYREMADFCRDTRLDLSDNDFSFNAKRIKMKAADDKIAKTLIDLEISLNERWSSGDSSGYLENYHEGISYFDPVAENQLIGRPAVLAHLTKLYKNPHIVRNEYLHPHVIVSEDGGLAVLGYNLNTFVVDESGKEKQLRAWNATEVYRLIDGKWRIVHSNWALTKSLDIASAS
ncbi:YybH family protein [Burkholderia stagnalis]|uniref:YybH family protein n=1 Tax=Burkholderia stagnalis TaxID=1503054 RepID=UPI001E2E5F81|nr:nuclear transport factor 2 family protein [Burkholderia stagnalis]